MEWIAVGYYLVLLLLSIAPFLAPLCLLVGTVVMTSSARRRSPSAWWAFVALAALVAAYWAYGGGFSRGGFGLLEKDEGCGVDDERVVGVEESFLPLSFRCTLDDGTVLELIPPATMPLSLGFLVLAVLAAAIRIVGRRRDRRRVRDGGSLGSPP